MCTSHDPKTTHDPTQMTRPNTSFIFRDLPSELDRARQGHHWFHLPSFKFNVSLNVRKSSLFLVSEFRVQKSSLLPCLSFRVTSSDETIVVLVKLRLTWKVDLGRQNWYWVGLFWFGSHVVLGSCEVHMTLITLC